MFNKVPKIELQSRLSALRTRMDSECPEWQLIAIFSKINQFYFTGTMQDGVVLIPRDKEATYWVRRSLQRAQDESEFADIRPMNSFRDAADAMAPLADTVHLETERVPLAMYQRFNKHFSFKHVAAADNTIAMVRSIKSSYELERMERSGLIHQKILEQRLPQLLEPGMSEAELGGVLYQEMIAAGHHGIARFSMYDTEVLLGHICFGESSIYPTSFDGPGGNYGMSPAVPLLGSRERKLSAGDLVFVDIGCGYDGYHTDKTMTYVYRGQLPDEAIAIHKKCVQIQNDTAKLLKPGAIPEQIYAEITDKLEPEFLKGFMGFGARQARFLGHGIGLYIDEIPVLAKGFVQPLQKNMVLAIEPKKGVAGIGLLGTENTFVVTTEGGRCITGNHPGLMYVA
ncbi:MAG: peptidase M24 [Desulfobacteraceae bacterium 4572_35.1]|nr:MAG: peptidase M24 [Desulfobacteraceae bacterium 4572_35.1]